MFVTWPEYSSTPMGPDDLALVTTLICPSPPTLKSRMRAAKLVVKRFAAYVCPWLMTEEDTKAAPSHTMDDEIESAPAKPATRSITNATARHFRFIFITPKKMDDSGLCQVSNGVSPGFYGGQNAVSLITGDANLDTFEGDVIEFSVCIMTLESHTEGIL